MNDEVLDLAQLKECRDLVNAVDWDLTPQQAFETYQLKSRDNWRASATGEVLYFYVSAWQGENKVFLVRRTLKHSEEIAEIAVPDDLVAACVVEQEGSYIPRGQCPINDQVRDWLQAHLKS